jgi:hypothetical protein
VCTTLSDKKNEVFLMSTIDIFLFNFTISTIDFFLKFLNSIILDSN